MAGLSPPAGQRDSLWMVRQEAVKRLAFPHPPPDRPRGRTGGRSTDRVTAYQNDDELSLADWKCAIGGTGRPDFAQCPFSGSATLAAQRCPAVGRTTRFSSAEVNTHSVASKAATPLAMRSFHRRGRPAG